MKLAALILAIALSGCSILQTSVNFDNVEHAGISAALTTSQFLQQDCKAGPQAVYQRLMVLSAQLRYIQNYSSKRSGDKNLYDSLVVVGGIANETVQRYETSPVPSNAFCELKADVIVKALDDIAKTSGARL